MQIKQCPTCKVEKNIEQYNKNKTRKDGLQRECRECCHNHHNKHYQTKKSVRLNENLQFNHKICSNCKQELPFKQFNKAKLGRFGLSGECKKCLKLRNRNWLDNTGKEWCNQWMKDKKSSDPQFKLKQILRMRLLDALKRKNTTKNHSAITLLGCSIEYAQKHLEKQFKPEMTWENHGRIWEIDHKTPCASFDLTYVEQQQKCFNYTNLQPLTISENRSKGKKL